MWYSMDTPTHNVVQCGLPHILCGTVWTHPHTLCGTVWTHPHTMWYSVGYPTYYVVQCGHTHTHYVVQYGSAFSHSLLSLLVPSLYSRVAIYIVAQELTHRNVVRSCFLQLFQVLLTEVGHTNRPDQLVCLQLHHGIPGLQDLAPNGRVDHISVNVTHTQSAHIKTQL